MAAIVNKTFIIAEAGVNHNGDLQKALEMVDVAAKAGADAIKFQTFSAQDLTTIDAPKADYQKQVTSIKESQQEMLAALELNYEEYQQIYQRCQVSGIEFMSTAFDQASLDFLLELGIKRIKIPSGELTNLPFLRYAASKGLPMIVSTGMADMQEIEVSIKALLDAGAKNYEITILHCNTAYPTPYEDVNMACLQTIKDKLQLSIGYSDHTLGDEIALASVALGASVLEKHFTLDRNLPGPDHATSLQPDELVNMVARIRNVEQAIGNDIKQPTESEKPNVIIARKSIVAKAVIKQGELFSEKNITAKRPGSGISPMLWDEVIGQPAKQDFAVDELIEL